MYDFFIYFLIGVLPAIILTFGFSFILKQNNLKFNRKKLLITILMGGVLTFICFTIIPIETFIYIFWPATFSFLLGWSIEWKNIKTTFDNLILKKTHLEEEKKIKTGGRLRLPPVLSHPHPFSFY